MKKTPQEVAIDNIVTAIMSQPDYDFKMAKQALSKINSKIESMLLSDMTDLDYIEDMDGSLVKNIK